MTIDDDELEQKLRAGDPAGFLSHERLARLEARIVGWAAKSAQERDAYNLHDEFAITGPRRVGQGLLAAVALLALGIVVGQNITPVASVAASPSSGTALAMASSWDVLLAGQGGVKP